MITPPLKPGSIPRFHELDEDAFEDLCRDLMQEEDDVVAAERYGTRGQRQFGADLLIDCADGSLWVGQCKSHKECDERLIRTACEDFLKYADRWSAKGVTKFLLFLAADTRRQQLHDERLRQREELRARGFSFTVWSAAVFKSKLSRYPRIVQHFFPYLLHFICGHSAAMEVLPAAQTMAVITLASQFAERVDGEHAELRGLWRDGYPNEALLKLRKLKEQISSLAAISPPTMAKLLHLEGRLLVAIGEVAAAKRIVPPTITSDVSGRARLVAMIAQAEGRLEDAITALRDDADADSRVLRAALHLQHDQEPEALEILERLQDHPEAKRLRAMTFLARGDVPNARVEAERALHLAPSWYWMRRTAATIRYLAGLSPVVTPKGLPEWPQPISSGLVRQDNESVAARRAAGEEFSRLADPRFQHSKDDAACIDAWSVACLVDDPGSRQRATQIATSSLEGRPDNYRVLAWVLARGLPVAIETSTDLFQAKVDRSEATPEETTALVAAYATKREFAMATGVLEQFSSNFASGPERVLADSWRTQLKKLAEAPSDGPNGNTPDRIRRALAQLHSARANDDDVACWEQYTTLAQLGRWDEVAQAAADLVRLFQTAESVRLACHALYNVDDVTGCLEMLRQAKAAFLNGELSPDLRRLQVVAQRDAGALPEAVRGARGVFEESKTADAFMELVRLYFQMGDLKSLAITARGYRSVRDLTAFDHLVLASYLKLEDPALALSLWEAAIAAGIEDKHVGFAFELGSNLVADKHLDVLAQRLTALGFESRGGIQAVGFDDLVKRMTERRQQMHEVLHMLRKGTLPIHLVSQATGTPLASVLRRFRLLNKMRPDSSVQSPIYQRFGGRAGGCLRVEGVKEWRLIADITGILSAEYFGILGLVEKEFGCIRIPQGTLVALNAMRDALSHSQPDRAGAKRRLGQLVADGLVKIVDLEEVPERRTADGDVADDILALLRYASSRGALVVEFLPPRSTDPGRYAMVTPSAYRRSMRDVHSVVDALLATGAVSTEEHASATRRLGHRWSIPSDVGIEEGTELVCRSDIVVLLATAGVLDAVVGRFRIAVPGGDAAAERSEVDETGRREADGNWIGRIIDRIREGLESGTYRFLPKVPKDQDERNVGESGELEGVLREVLAVPGSDSDILWVDDRCINAYAHSEGKRIVDMIDLLFYLRNREKLSEEELFRILGEVRATDSRFVAFGAGELLNALRDAPLRDGVLVETERLRVFRQYYARCLLEADSLRGPDESSDRPDASTEWQFLLSCGRAVLDCMVAVWQMGSHDEKVARTDWLLRNMYTDDRGLHDAGMVRQRKSEEYLSATAIASLMGMALQLDSADADRTARHSYFEWLDQRIIRNRFSADKTVLTATVEQVKGLLTAGARGETEADAIGRALRARLWLDLPERVRAFTDEDQDFLTKVGAMTRSVASIGPLQVESHRLWEGLAKVLNERSSVQVRSIDGEAVALGLVSESPVAFSVQCASAGVDAEIAREEFGFLWNSVGAREAAAKRVGGWFDLPEERRSKTISTVVAGQDAGTRMETAMAARTASGTFFYRELAARLREGGRFRPAEAMPVDARVLIGHLRLEESDAAPDRWERAIERLVQQVGVVETAIRTCGVPVRLAESFVHAVRSLPIHERNVTLRLCSLDGFGRRPQLGTYISQICGRVPAFQRAVRSVCAVA